MNVLNKKVYSVQGAVYEWDRELELKTVFRVPSSSISLRITCQVIASIQSSLLDVFLLNFQIINWFSILDVKSGVCVCVVPSTTIILTWSSNQIIRNIVVKVLRSIKIIAHSQMIPGNEAFYNCLFILSNLKYISELSMF